MWWENVEYDYGATGNSLSDNITLHLRTFILIYDRMPGWHGGFMRWLSSILPNVLHVRSQPGTDNFVQSVCCFVLFLDSVCSQEYSCMYVILHGGVNCLNSIACRCYMYV